MQNLCHLTYHGIPLIRANFLQRNVAEFTDLGSSSYQMYLIVFYKSIWLFFVQELIQIDGQILYGLLKRLFPQIHKFLVSLHYFN